MRLILSLLNMKRTKPTMDSAFWQWVASRKVTDTPRGDFIGDTRDLMAAGVNPTEQLDSYSTCSEARAIAKRMFKAYQKQLVTQ